MAPPISSSLSPPHSPLLTFSPSPHTTQQPIRGHFSFLSREEEICRLGWLLLFLWLGMVIYMTKEIWCGSAMKKESSDSTRDLVVETKGEEIKDHDVV